MWAKIITIKRTKDLNYFSLCAFNLFNTRVSQFELNYWTCPRHSNLLRCTCMPPCQEHIHAYASHPCCLLCCMTCRWWKSGCSFSLWDWELKIYFFTETSWNVDSSEHSTHFQCLLAIWGELWPREPSSIAAYNWCTAFFVNRLTQFNYHLFTFILFLLFFLHPFLGEGAQQYNSA